MAEGEEAAVAKQQIEAEKGDGVGKEGDQQIGVKWRCKRRYESKRHDADRDQYEPGTLRHEAAFPNSPEGLMSRVPITIR